MVHFFEFHKDDFFVVALHFAKFGSYGSYEMVSMMMIFENMYSMIQLYSPYLQKYCTIKKMMSIACILPALTSIAN